MTSLASKTLPLPNSNSRIIDKKSIVPTTANSKFRRKPKSLGSKGGVNDDGNDAGNKAQSYAEAVTDVEFCEELLRDGFVQSYVDFYHLTHRQDPNDPSADKIDVSLNDMKYIKSCLTDAESCRRVGNTAGVYASYTKLADYYSDVYDFKTSLFFHQKCLDVSQLTSDLRAEMAANHSLGIVNQRIGDYETARLYHERHEEISISVDAEAETSEANAELYKVYLAIANSYEKSEDMENSMDMHLKCLEASKKCWNKALEGEANGRIGNTLLRLQKASDALPYLSRFSELAAELSDANARCRACSSLALVYDTLGLADKALDELSLVQTISEQAGDLLLQSQACKAMGTLYSKVGNLSEAVHALQRHFDLLKILDARSVSEGAAGDIGVKDLDLARVYVGISKGNASMGAYVLAIKFDFSSLLDWKLNRTNFTEPLVDESASVTSTSVTSQQAKNPAIVTTEGMDKNVNTNNGDSKNKSNDGSDINETETGAVPVPAPAIDTSLDENTASGAVQEGENT